MEIKCPNCGCNPQDAPYYMDATHCPKCGHIFGKAIKSREEMIHYLGLYEDTIEEFDLSSTIDTAMEMQKTYDLSNGYGLGLECDFDSTPHVLEDLKDNEELIEVERENGIVVYCKKESEV